MAITFEQIGSGLRLSGVLPATVVTVVAIERQGESSATLTYKTDDGTLGALILSAESLGGISEVDDRRWTFDADPEMFRLASEARRMKWAHLSDPFAAVDTSNIEPYPHQIEAVYQRFLERQPLKFLLADDPGAGKTIMSGLFIRELILRGDVERCLIVAPGSLVEQWQDELGEKFGLEFGIMSRAKIDESRTGNPFIEHNMLVARIDQLSRSEELIEKLKVSEWDLVIVDEAHKMAARRFGDKLNKTGRFELGEVLRDRTRHFLLLTATPHNGKNDDFAAFMTLLAPDRFGGRIREGEMPDVDDLMRRRVKENLRKFDGTPLFTKRYAHTLPFELSPLERELYEDVSAYVRTGMNRAMALQEGGDKRRGLIVGFALAGLQRRLASSPAAIFRSLRRRHERLTQQAGDLREAAASGAPIPASQIPRALLRDIEDFDFDDYGDVELEELENIFIDASTASATAAELETELLELKVLVDLAEVVRDSGEDTKWVELRGLLRSPEFKAQDPPRKLIIFTEHRDTLDYVAARVAAELGRPEAVVTIHGSVKRHDRRVIQDRFRVDPVVRVMVATDAAGEGVNLQVANLMVNYDLPWNPNRIEQRFGRIHRIGQELPCHLWNLLAQNTREGDVFERLFQKIEQQKGVYGDQVYDVLGASQLNASLRDLLIRAIRADQDPAHEAYMNEVIEVDIGGHLKEVLDQRVLVGGLGAEERDSTIKDLMEQARVRRLQPGFVGSFFTAALRLYGGRIAGREQDRHEITRVPASIRSHRSPTSRPVHDRYARVTFDKRFITIPDGERAELIAPGTPLLDAVVARVLEDHSSTLDSGAVLVATDDTRTEPRLLVYLDHTVTDGRIVHGHRQVVSRRFQYVEIDQHGNVTDPGPEPYIGYAAPTPNQQTLIDEHVDPSWAGKSAENTAKAWAIEHLAGPHFDELRTITKKRVGKVREAVRQRMVTEIRYWQQKAEETKRKELAGKKPSPSSGTAMLRSEEFEDRWVRRRLELDIEENLQNSPPTIVGAALIIPTGLLDTFAGHPPDADLVAIKAETDRRAVAAVMQAELDLGRVPTEQEHSNPGFDIESVDPVSGTHFFIEVKGHLPGTTEIHVSSTQVQKAKSNPERWRLAVASVPIDPAANPIVRYLVEPFADYTLHFAQTSLPMNVAELLSRAGTPQ